ncbi:MAG: hypothetical protein WC485_04585 [Opitutaceae bacterium]
MSALQKVKPSASAGKRVVLLPDHAFFVRVVPLAPGLPPEEIPAQVELALEGLSPFPVPQLCYGYFHPPGADRLLVYAAYRRRFTVEDAAAWADADAVLPAFAAWLGLAPAGPLALLVNGADFITALGWDGRDAVPAVVATQPVAADAPPETRAAARAALVAQLTHLPPPVEVAAPAGTTSRGGDDGVKFTAGSQVSRLATAQLDRLDVRDKDELAVRRHDRARDQFLWRAFLGCVAAIVLAGALQLGLKGGRLWLAARAIVAAAQAPAVQGIETRHALATRIDELSTRRLRPIRMLEIVNEKRPRTIQFLRVATKGLYGLEIEGQTGTTPDVFNYEAALKDLPACAQVDLGQTTDRGGITRFTLTVTFKPEALRPAPPPS